MIDCYALETAYELLQKIHIVIHDQAIQSSEDTITVDLGSKSHWNAVRSPFRSGLLEVLTSGNPATARQLADLFDIEAPLIHYHLGLLENAGFVTGERMLGKRGKIYSAVGTKYRVSFNSDSSVEQERANQLADSWLRASMNDILQAMINKDELSEDSNVIFNWESLNKEDIAEIKTHFERVREIMQVAKERRQVASLKEQRPTCHVLFGVISKEFSVPPNPEFSTMLS